MKKTIMIMAAGLMLAGCTQEDIFNNESGYTKGEIGVRAFVPAATRGVAYDSEIEDNGFQENGSFELFAYHAGDYDTPFMGSQTDGVNFEWDGSRWYYTDNSEIKFWEQAEGNAIDFYAISPADLYDINSETGANITSPYGSDGTQQITYIVPDNSSEQIDLMYAKKEDVDPTDENTISNGIALDFYHALSQIVFKAKTENEYIYADVESVSFGGVYDRGLFELANAAFGDEYDYESSYNGYAGGGWQDLYGAEIKEYLTETEETFDINSYYDEEYDEYTVETLTNSSSALLLIPQKRDAADVDADGYGDLESGAYIKVSCRVRYSGDNGSVNVFGNGEAKDEYKELYVPMSVEWKPGYKYVYTLVFSADLGEPISVYEQELTVAAWNETGNENNGDEYEEVPTEIEGIAYDAETNTFSIASAADLLKLSERVNEGASYESGYGTRNWNEANYIQTDDIDLSEVCGEGIGNWTPIGANDGYFDGTFKNEGEYEISNLYYDGSGEYVGLFGKVYDNAVIEGVRITSGTVSNNEDLGKTGGIAAWLNEGEIKKCSNGANISGGSRSVVGGVVGSAQGIVWACYNTGDIEAESSAGGIAGYSYQSGDIVACYNTGQISAYEKAGGIVGAGYQHFIACYNKGEVTGASTLGGIIGLLAEYGSGEDSFVACYYGGSCTANAAVGSSEYENTMENVPESATTDWNTAVVTMNAYLTDYGWHYEIDGDNITLAEGNAE